MNIVTSFVLARHRGVHRVFVVLSEVLLFYGLVEALVSENRLVEVLFGGLVGG